MTPLCDSKSLRAEFAMAFDMLPVRSSVHIIPGAEVGVALLPSQGRRFAVVTWHGVIGINGWWRSHVPF